MVFTCQGVTLRAARRDDLSRARAWTLLTEQLIRPEFWILHAKGIHSYVAEDRGGVIFFVKLVEKGCEVELHLLFGSDGLVPDYKWRTMNAMMVLFPWVEKALALGQTKAVFFISRSPGLIRFAQKRLGFVDEGPFEFGGNKIVKRL